MPFMLQDTSKTAVAQWARCVFLAAQKGDREAKELLADAVRAPGRGSRVRRASGCACAIRRSRSRAACSKINRVTSRSFSTRLGEKLAHRRVVSLKIPRRDRRGAVGGSGKSRCRGNDDSATTRPSPNPPASPLSRRPPPSSAIPVHAAWTSVPFPAWSIFSFAKSAMWKRRSPRNASKSPRPPTLVAKKLSAGGRLIYMGAGTSGRLGVVDSSEMPPTFNAPPEQVQAIIAGGAAAVFRSQEGAEDARDTGVAELKARGLTKKDVVCGIAASGQTPFVLAALDYARDLGAGTILLTCNPKRTIRVKVDVEIDLPTGPEIVTGSTRMKAGTATKLVLNMLSTIAMVRLGRVRDNLMVNVQATNDKLRARAVRLVQALTNATFEDAQTALEKTAWRVTAAAVALQGKSAAQTQMNDLNRKRVKEGMEIGDLRDAGGILKASRTGLGMKVRIRTRFSQKDPSCRNPLRLLVI